MLESILYTSTELTPHFINTIGKKYLVLWPVKNLPVIGTWSTFQWIIVLSYFCQLLFLALHTLKKIKWISNNYTQKGLYRYPWHNSIEQIKISVSLLINFENGSCDGLIETGRTDKMSPRMSSPDIFWIEEESLMKNGMEELAWNQELNLEWELCMNEWY